MLPRPQLNYFVLFSHTAECKVRAPNWAVGVVGGQQHPHVAGSNVRASRRGVLSKAYTDKVRDNLDPKIAHEVVLLIKVII